MIVGVAARKDELSINPLQFLFGKTIKGSFYGGMKLVSKAGFQ